MDFGARGRLEESQMSRLYPTVYNQNVPFGVPTYEIRGTQVYPTVHNKRDRYGGSVFEIRESQLFPTVNNKWCK
jgi:hypothetical protein